MYDIEIFLQGYKYRVKHFNTSFRANALPLYGPLWPLRETFGDLDLCHHPLYKRFAQKTKYKQEKFKTVREKTKLYNDKLYNS